MKLNRFLIFMMLTLLSISAVSAVDGDVMADDSVLESQTHDDVELESVESEIPDNPAEVDRDYPSIWINMEVDNPYDLGEGN